MSNKTSFSQNELQHPLLRKLSDLLDALTGLRLLIVYPDEAGWKQVSPGSQRHGAPEFCRLIQSSQQGVKLCQTCHVLLSVAACSAGLPEQTCHAGARVFLAASPANGEGGFAVLSSCAFADHGTWPETAARGRKLGIDLPVLRKAFRRLPNLSGSQRALVRTIMDATIDAMDEIRRNVRLQQEQKNRDGAGHAHASLARLLNERLMVPPARSGKRGRSGLRDRAGKPLLIRVLEKVIRERPGMPLSVEAIAAAARMTPNHFSAVFHRYTGRCFTDYLAERRIEAAKHLLGDLILSVSEVGRQTGYDDPGYFARRFRQRTGLSPREWRNRLRID